MDPSEFSNIGSKIRKERRAKGLSQSDLSKKLEISASYLNLLESGRRTITVPLLIKIGNELGISLKDLTVESNKRILSDIMDVLSNELFEDLDITNQDTSDFIGSNPNIAKALLKKDGYLILEVGIGNHPKIVESIFRKSGYNDIKTFKVFFCHKIIHKEYKISHFWKTFKIYIN